MWQTILDADKSLLLWLNGSWGAVADQVFYVISEKLTWIPLYIAIIYVMWRRLGTREAVYAVLFLVVAIGAADQFANFFKTYTPKFRPSHTPDIETMVHVVNDYRGGLYGTVSAHAAISFLVARFTSLLFRKQWYTISIFLWAVVVAYSRIYLGMHYPLDVLFGTATGLVFGSIAYNLFMKWHIKRMNAAKSR